MLRPILIAVQFLTLLPVSRLGAPTTRELGQSVLVYPLVGLVIGLLLASLQVVLTETDPALGAALILTVWVLITGALHLDGLADSADAWIGGHADPNRTLEIMKDPRAGPAGVVAVVLLLLIKFAALGVLVREGAWTVLVLAPVLGRGAVLGLFITTPYVRPGGIGEALSNELPAVGAWFVLLAVGLGTVLIGGWRGAGILLCVALVAVVLRAIMVRRIGGTTGDTAGAFVELLEATSILVPALL